VYQVPKQSFPKYAPILFFEKARGDSAVIGRFVFFFSAFDFTPENENEEAEVSEIQSIITSENG